MNMKKIIMVSALVMAAQIGTVQAAEDTNLSPVVIIPAGTKLAGRYEGFTLAAPVNTAQTVPTTAHVRDGEGREFDIPVSFVLEPAK